MTSQASANESARKKIHAKQTTWKVTKRCRGAAPAGGALDEVRSAAPPALGDERGAMDRPPRDERPAGPVPEPADEHRQHEVPVREETAPRLPPSGMYR